MFIQSLRMTRRDWRAGELRFLLVALIVAVAALSSVGFFIDRLRAGLERDAHQLLAADLLVATDQPLLPQWLQQAQLEHLQTAQTIVFPSMAVAGQGDGVRSVLSSIKAVSSDYPLRGRLSLASDNHTQDGKPHAASGIPERGTVWVDQAILVALQLHVGDHLKLGSQQFRIAGLIANEPDRGSAFVNFAPRVMLALDDLTATGLVQFGSRLTYRLLLAGTTERIKSYQRWLQTHIDTDNLKGVRIESIDSGRPEIRATLDRAQQFLSLVGLLSSFLAAVAVALAARRFMLRHLDACAMLRCFGMTQTQVTWLYMQEFLLIGLVGSALGVLMGFVAHFALLSWLAGLVATSLPPASWWPAVQGLAVGVLLLVGFALPPLLQLRNVPHNRVLRRDASAPKVSSIATYVLGSLVFIGLLLWQAGDIKLGLLTALGFLGACGLFALLAWVCLRALGSARGWFGNQGWRFAIQGLQRRPGASIVQIVALSLGLMALLLLTVIRGDLIAAWRQSTPLDAPNRFVINIQPDQKEAVAQRLQQANIAQAPLYPMIRGRLVQINDKPVTNDSYHDDRARRLVDREFNLSTMRDLPAQNTIVAGHWFDDTRPEASVEEGAAKTLGLQLGDHLQFDIAGQLLSVPITSIRKLEWGSLRVNFFVIINPTALQDMPQTWITAFHLPPEQASLANLLTRDFPNLTVVDIGSVLQQIQSIVDQVVAAVQFLFLFALLAGALVLYAALVGTHDIRIREAGLLRALGATRRQLAQAQRIEVMLVGGLAGLLAASGAGLAGWVLARNIFDFDWHVSAWLWLAGALVGMGCTLAGGWLGLRKVLSQPPLQTLREG
ncbi:putative ABC transport system permease protein [Herbaspirillum sp. Sphag1AN]|uniref:ABC transporter permease n=1 Tax=unclassified Herbaspirillum TaxID=2624150 RepID=UPI001613A541|nr:MULTISPECIES: FtsX-like permease family protein [unclassified Herbaspirillum]MBB3210875.1 putative ABC transport system permease protein [Herbaspirillum sp. Sphag1AN]MBB3244505.1 putative ABC transport system permease protein [Herbaspirillum sp. Sphag64]